MLHLNETTIKLLAAVLVGLIKSLTVNGLFPCGNLDSKTTNWFRNLVLSMQIPDTVTLLVKVYDILIGLEHNQTQLRNMYWNWDLFKHKEILLWPNPIVVLIRDIEWSIFKSLMWKPWSEQVFSSLCLSLNKDLGHFCGLLREHYNDVTKAEEALGPFSSFWIMVLIHLDMKTTKQFGYCLAFSVGLLTVVAACHGPLLLSENYFLKNN